MKKKTYFELSEDKLKNLLEHAFDAGLELANATEMNLVEVEFEQWYNEISKQWQ